MKEFTFNYRYGLDLPCGRNTITVQAENKQEAEITAINTLRDQKRYFGYWLEIVK
jgi:di/tripeptidase